MPLITLDNISLQFSEKLVLNEISATIQKGDKIALIGRNGEGKTSLLRVLAGIIDADDGEIKVKNNTSISYLEQSTPKDIDQSLFAVVAKGLGSIGDLLANYYQSTQSDNAKKSNSYQILIEQENAWHYIHKIEAILNRFKLDPETKLSAMSGGWKRRVMLARAIIQEPDLLLLDEPMAGMNLEEKQDMCRFILDINEQYGTTIVLIEHDMGVVMDISERLIVLDYGRKIAEGTPDEILGNQTVIDAYLGVTNAN